MTATAHRPLYAPVPLRGTHTVLVRQALGLVNRARYVFAVTSDGDRIPVAKKAARYALRLRRTCGQRTVTVDLTPLSVSIRGKE